MPVLDPAGPHAAGIVRYWWLTFWVSVVVLGAVSIVLVYAILRRRSSGSLPAPFTPDHERGTAVGVWIATALTVVTLLVLLTGSVLTSRALSSSDPHNALTIQVTGNQWWWDVEYQDPEPARRVRTANEIHIPVGRPVLIRTRSRDVIHSFWVPALNGKKDNIPDHPSSVWLKAERPGVFAGQCAEFCGYQHAHMRLLVTAEPADVFDAWLTAQRAVAPEPMDPVARRGRDVFLAGSCALCHTILGTPAGARTGPDLTHLASRTTLGAGTMPNTIGHLAGWIVDPQGVKPGARMPATSVGADDLQALLAYLGSLR